MVFFNELKRLLWQIIQFLESQCLDLSLAVISLILEIFLMHQKENEALDEYILIMLTKVAFSTDVYM